MLDVLIIGAGPIGIATALEAKKKQLNYIVIEKGALVNSLYNYPVNMKFFSSAERLEIDNVPFITTNVKPIRAEALEYYRRIAINNSLHINLFQQVIAVDQNHGHYSITTNKSAYTAKNIVVATGFYDIPNLLDIPGEDLPKVFHYYKDPHYFAGQKVVVVGASNSAVDAALEIYRKGGQVTMIIRGPSIGSRVKYWVKPDIENRIEEGSIQALYQSKLLAIRKDEVDILLQNGTTTTIENDFVLAMTGYMPDFTFLKTLGIHLSDDGKSIPMYNPETMESN
ncbi:MAG: YpdA family putative bacillithiol disulfide reductase [Chitinophagales bacterium]|nr:YpdA family putative bacillithiol disulfide reductase [Chitinophagales bacterium]